MISYGKLVVICSVLIVFNFMLVVNHWITNSQNDVTKVQPCHRKDCCFLSESAKEPEKTVEVKKEKEIDQGNIFFSKFMFLDHR